MIKDPMFKVLIAAIAAYAIVVGCYAYATNKAEANEVASVPATLDMT